MRDQKKSYTTEVLLSSFGIGVVRALGRCHAACAYAFPLPEWVNCGSVGDGKGVIERIGGIGRASSC